MSESVAQGQRDPACVERWPECESGAYDPRCCRFPKECACTSYPPDESPAANIVLLDTRDVTIWRDADDAFQVCVGRPDDFRSAEIPKTLMLMFLRNLDELLGSGRG